MMSLLKEQYQSLVAHCNSNANNRACTQILAALDAFTRKHKVPEESESEIMLSPKVSPLTWFTEAYAKDLAVLREALEKATVVSVNDVAGQVAVFAGYKLIRDIDKSIKKSMDVYEKKLEGSSARAERRQVKTFFTRPEDQTAQAPHDTEMKVMK
jgi:hypothetical protein